MEHRTAQLRVRKRAIIAEGTGGTIFWATPSRARLLIDSGAVDLVNAGPSEQPSAGPSEIKPAEPLEKKSSAAGQDGPLTASALSSESGPAAASSSSEAAPASPESNAMPSEKRGPGRPRKYPR